MSSDIEVKRLTARGRGAVAVVRVRLQTSEQANRVDQCFTAINGIPAATAAVGRILYGHWGLEDVVVVRTAELEYEVNCHGGEAAVDAICQSLVGNQTKSARANSEAVSPESRLNAELLKILLQCRTRQTAEFALAQYQGVLRNFLQWLRDCSNVNRCLSAINAAISWNRFAEHLTKPWKVAVVGQPNAGKSSLLNAMVGYERSIVFDQPGTTRDRVETEITLDGLPFLLADTAGIREATDDIESLGIAEARTSISTCDACLIVVDSTSGWTSDDDDLLQLVPPNCNVAVLLNKCDLLDSDATSEALLASVHSSRSVFVLATSATEKIGISELLNWLPSVLAPDRPAIDQPLLLVSELRQQLQLFSETPDIAALLQVLDAWL
ncbi:MAG: GTPase [Fuerstiella sp.]